MTHDLVDEADRAHHHVFFKEEPFYQILAVQPAMSNLSRSVSEQCPTLRNHRPLLVSLQHLVG